MPSILPLLRKNLPTFLRYTRSQVSWRKLVSLFSPMAYDFSALDALMASALDRVFPAAQVQVRVGGTIAYDARFGFLGPEARTRPTTTTTRFDLASVSKLFTVVAFMTLVEEGRTGLDQPVVKVLSEFGGRRPIAPYPDPLRPSYFIEVAPHSAGEVDAGTITFR